MKKILCIGELLIDMICTDKDQPLTEGLHFLKKPGGAPANAAAAIAALGGKVALVAKTGTDPFGQYLLTVLTEFGIDTRWVLQDPRHFTTLAFVSLLKNGDRDFHFNRGADGQLTGEEVNTINLDEFSFVHFGSATAFLPGPLQTAYHDLFETSRQKGLFTSFDPNYRELLFGKNKPAFIEQSMHFIRHCHFFKVSDEEALLLTAKNNVQEAAKELQRYSTATFAITTGKEGALLSVGKTILQVPGVPVIPVDTTGAGDAFTGAVLYQLSQLTTTTGLTTEAWQQFIFNANKAGAKTCTYMGAMEAFKQLNASLFQ